jgi:hypothetical protein
VSVQARVRVLALMLGLSSLSELSIEVRSTALPGGCASGEEEMSDQDQTNADAEPALTDDEMELEENPGGEGEGE